MAGGLRAFRAKMFALLTLLLVGTALVVLYFQVVVWPDNRLAVVYFEEARNVGMSTEVRLEGEGPQIGRIRAVRRRTDLDQLEISRIDRDTFAPLLSLREDAPDRQARLTDYRIETPAGGRPRVTIWFDGSDEAIVATPSGPPETASAEKAPAVKAPPDKAPAVKASAAGAPRGNPAPGQALAGRVTADKASPAAPGEEAPIRVILTCGGRLTGRARRLAPGSRSWTATLETGSSAALVTDPCLIPIAVEPAGPSRWLDIEQFQLEGDWLWLQIPATGAAAGLSGLTLTLRDAAGGDSERVAFAADPHIPSRLTGRIAWADRALTPVESGNGRLETRPPEALFTFYPPAVWDEVTLCGYDELSATHALEEHAAPALGVARTADQCPGPAPRRSLVQAIKRGATTLFPFAGQRLLVTFHDPPQGQRALQEIELEIEPAVAGLEPGNHPDQWPFGFVPGDTHARVSSQFGFQAPVLQIVPGHGSFYVAQAFEPDAARPRLLVQAAQGYSEDFGAWWSLLSDPATVGRTAPKNRLEALTLSSFGMVQDAHRLATRLDRLSDQAGQRLEAIDFDQIRSTRAQLSHVMDGAAQIVTRFNSLLEPITPRVSSDVAGLLHELHAVARELEPMSRALSAPDAQAMKDAPLLVRTAAQSLTRMETLLERTTQVMARAEAVGGHLQEAMEGIDGKALARELSTLLEETHQVLRQTELLEYRLNRTWPLKGKPEPPSLDLEPATGDTGIPPSP